MTDQATFVVNKVRGVDVLSANGEFDIANVGDLRRALMDALAGNDGLIVALQGVSYLDSSALGVLITTIRQATVQRRKVLIVAPRGTASGKLLRIAALDQMAPLFETVDDAIASLGP